MSIELHTWNTPNGRKISVALEEMGLSYTVKTINISKGEQFSPAFVKISPNSKIPAIVDTEGPGGEPISIFESGAILIYLGDKTGKLIGTDAAGRYHAIEWVMFQMANVGPLFGQANHFLNKTLEKIPYAIERYSKEAKRITKVLEDRLGKAEYLAGDYSIADIATYVWLRNPKNEGISLDDYPNVKRWFNAIDARPAVQRAHVKVEDAAKEYLAKKVA
jgi:GST-like protein